MDSSVRIPGAFLTEIETIHNSTSYETAPPLRKRPRLDRTVASTPQVSKYSYGSESVQSFDLASPSPLANTTYRLAGGLDTPGGWQAQDSEYLQQIEAEQDYRPSRDRRAITKTANGGDPSQQQRSATTTAAWCLGKTAWAVTGGLAGRIFNFCWNTTFRGFSAGGGPTYEMGSGALNGASNTSTSQTSTKDVFSSSYVTEVVPGEFPNYTPESTLMDSRDLTSPITPGGGGNWVIVNRSREPGYFDGSVRKRSRASIAGRRTVSRSSLGTPTVNVSGASYASPRSRPTNTAFVKPRPSSGLISPAKSPVKMNLSDEAPVQRPRSSLASSHKRQSSATNLQLQSSPISPEIEEYRRKRRREDKKQDESLRKLNDQLQAMIRQGKEALGAKIEIMDDSDTDEGYFDDIRR